MQKIVKTIHKLKYVTTKHFPDLVSILRTSYVIALQ